MRETANRVRDAADPNKIAASAASEREVEPDRGSGPAPDQTAGEGAAAPAQGDPPLGDPPPEDVPGAPVDPPAPVNHIAAANSSGAIAAAAAERSGGDPTGSDPTGGDGIGVGSGPDGERRAPSGPAFHSAAPPPTGSSRSHAVGGNEAGTVDEGSGDGAAPESAPAGDGSDGGRVASSTDETARA